MDNDSFALRGIFCYNQTPSELATVEGFAVCENGCSAGVFEHLPERYHGISIIDHGSALILPGMTDLHLHAPQYPNCGLGMDLELLEWLERYTYVEEARYADPVYAKAAYGLFADALRTGFTTRACIFATAHLPATRLLADALERTGLKTMVGKVSMDRNAPDTLRESNAEQAIEAARTWVRDCRVDYQNVRPILTPRFVPSCSDALLEGLGKLAQTYEVPVQSHLSESPDEIRWVQQLHPETACYGGVYYKYGLFGGDCPTVMAHCVHSARPEQELLRRCGVTVAHCPTSNTNLRSGAAPVRAYLNAGVKIGLGSDISGGHTLSMPRVLTAAMEVSKLRWRMSAPTHAPLTLPEAFDLATRGGGAFFGKVGSFEEGYEFDAVVLDDRRLCGVEPLPPRARLERAMFLAQERDIVDKYVAGVRIAL